MKVSNLSKFLRELLNNDITVNKLSLRRIFWKYMVAVSELFTLFDYEWIISILGKTIFNCEYKSSLYFKYLCIFECFISNLQ